MRRGLGRKKRVRLPDGNFVEGTPIPFQAGGEHWNEYLLEDGSVLRAKLVATEIVQIDGQYDQDGNPFYLMQSTNVVAVSSPERLRREEG